MRSAAFAQLAAVAKRYGPASMVEDLVQDALLVAVEAGRHDLSDAENLRWLCGVVRNKARMSARTARRRGWRDHDWQMSRSVSDQTGAETQPASLIADLPPALRTLAALVLTGHNRREIAYLLALPDTALRQRVVALKRHLTSKGLAAPRELSGLNLDLAYGRIRDALLPALLRHGGIFAAHDPDGHLFVVRRSQIAPSRQVGMQTKEKLP